MALSINRKQNYLFGGMVILAILAAIFTYRFIEVKWLLFRQAENHFQAKEFKEAVAFYEESFAKGLVNVNALSHLAASYVAIGNFPKAIKWYRDYLEAQPEDVQARFAFARVLNWNGNIQESQEEYQKALEEKKKQDQLQKKLISPEDL